MNTQAILKELQKALIDLRVPSETSVRIYARMDEALTAQEGEKYFCPICQAEVFWVKGWYDCDNCGQLKEHPLVELPTPPNEGMVYINTKDLVIKQEYENDIFVISTEEKKCPKCGEDMDFDYYESMWWCNNDDCNWHPDEETKKL